MKIHLRYRADGLIEPSQNCYMNIFRHCAGGCIAVTEENLRETVLPLLFVHGVTEVILEEVKQ